ncbi:hypothetical protein, partial [Oceanicola sp. S124]|uniref:hypothetical protein n=1 Tax=Oceanicola sp. S124 TaxID=1042378 RepID=UPI001ED935F2
VFSGFRSAGPADSAPNYEIYFRRLRRRFMAVNTKMRNTAATMKFLFNNCPGKRHEIRQVAGACLSWAGMRS